MAIEKKEEETVVVSKVELDGILSRLKDLESGKKMMLTKSDRVKEHIAYLRMIDDELVVGVQKNKRGEEKSAYIYKNEHGDEFLRWDVVLESGKKVTVEMLEFLNDNNKINVKILDQKAKKSVKVVDVIKAENSDPHLNKNFSSFDVEQEVVSVEYDATVEILDGENAGKTLTISTRMLNI